ncbi:pimeloyl-ACP methyl ester carboxylesterase [Angulomicrobium tetraedrale]|uniref:Pimeloyl-ACP methyl ester carboxylesterase n=1 Tax=Ancylobacter tetraedralis TaxID=217068 RepID=A0A839YYC9_9HYPH|nr:alpha/beta hydrolase [Ancylobacter tetraedralis]MBB3769534.1 pimeloyl-ACP methyl ester carboxylesterase [Ancylobacter tetraedralis]
MQKMTNAAGMSGRSHFFRTSDGVTLHYLAAGEGRPVILIPGWSQTALEWTFQIAHLAATHHVLAVDMRGHGLSDKPRHGYRIARLAADLAEMIRALELSDVTLVGHSMGASVIWCYLELYGEANIDRLVFVDQAAAIVASPGWTEAERLEAGSILSASEATDLVERLAQDDGPLTASFVTSMFSEAYPSSEMAWILEQNALFPRPFAARLLQDHAFKDWRDVIARIARPCLCVGARRSIVPWQAMVATGRSIRDARTVIFEIEEGGSHFMFIENPARFNALVSAFLADAREGHDAVELSAPSPHPTPNP